MIYVEKIREYVKSMPLEEAVEKVIEECVRNNILREFLLKQRAEVFKMSIYEYDEERELKIIRADERELGREEERKNTEAERKKTEAERQEKEKALKKAEESIKALVSVCQEFASTKETTVEKLMEKCELSQEEAEEKVEKYWK